MEPNGVTTDPVRRAGIEYLEEICLPWFPEDDSLMRYGEAELFRNYLHGWLQLAAVGLGIRGEFLRGFQMNCGVREKSVCAEPFLCARVREKGATLKTLVVFHGKRDDEGNLQEIHVVRPCQTCALELREKVPGANIIITYAGRRWKIPVEGLLPLVAVRDPATPVKVRRAAYRFVSKLARPISQDDEVLFQECEAVAGQEKLRSASNLVAFGIPKEGEGRPCIARERPGDRATCVHGIFQRALIERQEIQAILVFKDQELTDPSPLHYEVISHFAGGADVFISWNERRRGRRGGRRGRKGRRVLRRVPIKALDVFRYKHQTATKANGLGQYEYE